MPHIIKLVCFETAHILIWGHFIFVAIGDSKRPLYILMASVGINIILDFIFVIGCRWSVAGVGCATVISQIFSAGMVCTGLMKTKDCYRLQLRNIRFHKGMLSRIIRIGLPAGFQSLMYSSSNVIIQANMNSFGTDTIAAWTAYGKIDAVFWMTISSFGIAITTFVGQNYGADLYDRVRRGVKVCLKLALSVSFGLMLILYFSGTYIFALFTTDVQVIERGMEILRFLVPAFWTYVFVEILSGSLRGMGDSLLPMIITSLGVCVLRVIWLFTAVPVWPSVRMVIVSYPMTWSVTSILFIFYYLYYVKKNGISERNNQSAMQRFQR